MAKMMKKILAPILAVLTLSFGCARPFTTKREKIPPPPSPQAIWVYGHNDSQGKWIPRHWIE